MYRYEGYTKRGDCETGIEVEYTNVCSFTKHVNTSLY